MGTKPQPRPAEGAAGAPDLAQSACSGRASRLKASRKSSGDQAAVEAAAAPPGAGKIGEHLLPGLLHVQNLDHSAGEPLEPLAIEPHPLRRRPLPPLAEPRLQVAEVRPAQRRISFPEVTMVAPLK